MQKFTPPDMPDAEVSEAVDLIKSKRPDLWARWVEHEKRDEGYSDIGDDILRLLTTHFTSLGASKCILLRGLIRVEARRDSGLPI